jgi:hypothetical protein
MSHGCMLIQNMSLSGYHQKRQFLNWNVLSFSQRIHAHNYRKFMRIPFDKWPSQSVKRWCDSLYNWDMIMSFQRESVCYVHDN